MHRAFYSLIFAVCLASLPVGACDRPNPEPKSVGLRIISLSPAISQTLVMNGCGTAVVGRSPWCTALPSGIPIAGSLREFDAEVIMALRPTHLLAQWEGAGPIDDQLARLCRLGGVELIRVHIDTIADVEKLVVGDFEGWPCQPSEAARLWQQRLEETLAPDSDQGGTSAALRVLVLSAGDPFLGFGKGTYLGDMLLKLGAQNAIERSGYPSLHLEDLLAIAPDRIVMVGSDSQSVERLREQIRGVVGEESVPAIHTIGDAAFTPGPQLLETAAQLRSCVLR